MKLPDRLGCNPREDILGVGIPSHEKVAGTHVLAPPSTSRGMGKQQKTHKSVPPKVLVMTTVPLPKPTGSWSPKCAKKMIISKVAFPASPAMVWSGSIYISRPTLAFTSLAPSGNRPVLGAIVSPVPIVHVKSRVSWPSSSRARGMTLLSIRA